MSVDSGFKKRQYREMKKVISEYRGAASLEDLIPNLETLLHVVAGADSEWDRTMFAQWASLEQAYAVMLADGRSELTIGETRRVEEAMNQAASLIDAKLTSRGQELGST